MSLSLDNQGHDLIRRTYSIDIGEDAHQKWLDEFESFLGARHVIVGSSDLFTGHNWNAGSTNAQFMVFGAKASPNERWVDHMQNFKRYYDLMIPRARRLGPEQFHHPQELFTAPDEARGIEAWMKDVHRFLGYNIYLGGVFGAESSRLGFLGIGFDDWNRVRSIQAEQSFWLTHLTGSSLLQQRLALSEAQRSVTQAGLDSLKWGIFVLDSARRVIATNRESDSIIQGPSGIRVAQGVFEAPYDIMAALANCSLSPVNADKGKTFLGQAGLPGHQNRYVVFASAFNDESAILGTTGVGTMIFVLDTKHFPPLDVRVAAKVFRLTEAEEAVAAEVLEGLARSEIAERRGVSLDTIKAQVRAVYSKTMSGNAAELAARVAMLAKPTRD
ncbi:hypothetical protein P1J78_21160 [Psychromarinibacter sp. C21-152]|uniref:HTH luxR-type domain-containing protein n=1 Tax=Psychromarinibacter sediminicola TaxID=3033385 RepID=A0AAE3NW68_9RHOB|nr:hypothetical protein [Psychromarinibacter sediminicola]MDF0603252.1 hypothetical protein [Psychromarinibacter sediminicola]